MGFFLRPKDTNLVRSDGYDRLSAETIAMSDTAQARYTQRPPGEALEARKDAPLPTGNWRGPVSRTVSLKGSRK